MEPASGDVVDELDLRSPRIDDHTRRNDLCTRCLERFRLRGDVGNRKPDAVDDASLTRLRIRGAQEDQLHRERPLAGERLEHDAAWIFAGLAVEIARVPLGGL